MTTEPPFSNLIPDVIIDAIESVTGRYTNYQIYPLNSYENRVYQIGMEDGAPLIAKFYRPERWTDSQILEEHKALSLLAQRGVSVATALEFSGRTLHTHLGFRFSISDKIIGRAPEPEDLNDLFQIGELIGQTHSILANFPLQERPSTSILESVSKQSNWLSTSDRLPESLKKPFLSTCQILTDLSEDALAKAGSLKIQTIHGDFHSSNLLKTEDGMLLLDFDDIQTGYPCQDLWLHLTSEEKIASQLSELIEGYESYYPFQEKSLSLISVFKFERAIRYATWLGQRWQDPAFPKAFPWYQSEEYWLGLNKELDEIKQSWGSHSLQD